VLIVFAAIAGFDAGFDVIAGSLGDDISVVCAHELADSDRVFHPDSGLSELDGRQRARKLAHRFGTRLEKRHPLGRSQVRTLPETP